MASKRARERTDEDRGPKEDEGPKAPKKAARSDKKALAKKRGEASEKVTQDAEVSRDDVEQADKAQGRGCAGDETPSDTRDAAHAAKESESAGHAEVAGEAQAKAEATRISDKQCFRYVAPDTELEFYIRFPQPWAFKSWMEVIAGVLPEACFEVHSDEAFQGLVVESVDAARICLLQGRFETSVEKAPGSQPSFFLRTQNLLACFKNVSAHYFVDIWRIAGQSNLEVMAFEPHVHSYTPKFSLRTLCKENDLLQLENLTYRIYVEFDLTCLRNIVKTAKEHKSDMLEIRIQVKSCDAESVGKKKTTTILVLKYENDEVSSSFTYQSSSEPDAEIDGRTIIRAADACGATFHEMPCEVELDELYRGRFGVEYLYTFLKSMERSTINLRLSDKMPLVLEHQQGNTCIRFVLAEMRE